MGGWPIGMMAWRIGGILDIDDQIRWISEAGFDALSVHAAPGEEGLWRGVAPESAGARRRAELLRAVQGFAGCEIHAPFAHTLATEGLAATVANLFPALDLAADVGATVVTVHAQPPPTETEWSLWQGPLAALNDAAAQRGLRIGLEITDGYDWLLAQDWPQVGVTLDVGHMYLDGGQPLRQVGSLRRLIGRLDERLVHLHLHDYNGAHDHVTLGRGHIDFGDILAGLDDISYSGMLCLELNPDRVSPDEIIASLRWLRQRIAERVTAGSARDTICTS